MAQSNLTAMQVEPLKAALKKLMKKKSFAKRCEKGHPGIRAKIIMTHSAKFKEHEKSEDTVFHLLTAYNPVMETHAVFFCKEEDGEVSTWSFFQELEMFRWHNVESAFLTFGVNWGFDFRDTMARETKLSSEVVDAVMETDYVFDEPEEVIVHRTMQRSHVYKWDFKPAVLDVYSAKQKNIPVKEGWEFYEAA